MTDAADARRAWGLREAELAEASEHKSRLLAAHGRLENLEYLRNTLLKYFELGPGAFEEIFPLLAAFLEFSPEERQRAHSSHLAHVGGADVVLSSPPS